MCSSGCVVKRTCSRATSLGLRSSQGVSARSARQFVSRRQRMPGSHATPPSMSTTLSSGSRSNVAMDEERDEVRHRAARRPQRVPLDVEADRARAAGRRRDAHSLPSRVDGDREAALDRRLEDRQVARLAVRPLRRRHRAAPGRSARPRAARRISAAAACASCAGQTMDARRRGSSASQRSRSHSLCARARAAAR